MKGKHRRPTKEEVNVKTQTSELRSAVTRSEKTESSKRALVLDTPEFPHRQKDHNWFFGIIVLFAALITLLAYYNEYLLSITVAVFAFALIRSANLKPKVRQTRITDDGIYWGEEFLPYHRLRAFYLSGADSLANVYLERASWQGQVRLIVPVSQLDEVIAKLSQHLPFHDHKSEPLSDKLSRYLRY